MITTREHLLDWVVAALRDHQGKAKLVDVAKHIWTHHENDLRDSDDLFYTWHYDMRWAATKLRKQGKLRAADKTPRGVWALT